MVLLGYIETILFLIKIDVTYMVTFNHCHSLTKTVFNRAIFLNNVIEWVISAHPYADHTYWLSESL